MAWDHCHTLATLQGVVNRTGPNLYITFVERGKSDIDKFWYDKFRRGGGWLSFGDFAALTSSSRLVNHGTLPGDHIRR